jgi:hypothetical protein
MRRQHRRADRRLHAMHPRIVLLPRCKRASERQRQTRARRRRAIAPRSRIAHVLSVGDGVPRSAQRERHRRRAPAVREQRPRFPSREAHRAPRLGKRAPFDADVVRARRRDRAGVPERRGRAARPQRQQIAAAKRRRSQAGRERPSVGDRPRALRARAIERARRRFHVGRRAHAARPANRIRIPRDHRVARRQRSARVERQPIAAQVVPRHARRGTFGRHRRLDRRAPFEVPPRAHVEPMARVVVRQRQVHPLPHEHPVRPSVRDVGRQEPRLRGRAQPEDGRPQHRRPHHFQRRRSQDEIPRRRDGGPLEPHRQRRAEARAEREPPLPLHVERAARVAMDAKRVAPQVERARIDPHVATQEHLARARVEVHLVGVHVGEVYAGDGVRHGGLVAVRYGRVRHSSRAGRDGEREEPTAAPSNRSCHPNRSCCRSRCHSRCHSRWKGAHR